MADLNPYSDELDGSRPQEAQGSEPDAGAENAPAQTPQEAQTPGMETEPNSIDASASPRQPDAGNEEESSEWEIEDDIQDDTDEFDEEDIADDGMDELDVDAEPNDTDSQVAPPHDLPETFGEELSDDPEDMIPDEMLHDLDDSSDETHEMEEGVAPEKMAGTVTLVGVPIGNRDDITFRALRTLQMADIVVCEEYKTAARLLRNYNISKKLIEMNEHNEEESSNEVIELIRKGKKVAVISDAGLPVLADPGSLLSRKLRKLGIEPKIVPGVSSVMTGLMASGYAIDRFEFVGFLPRKPEERRNAAGALADRDGTIAILEAPYRLRSLLAALAEAMPQRRAALAINLTTPFETTIRGTLAELNAKFAQKRFKGEFVVVLDRLVPTDLGISTTAGFVPGELDVEEEEEYEENEPLDLTPMDAGERPLRRTPPRSEGRERGERNFEERRAPRTEGRFNERPPRRDGGNRGWERGGGGGRENRWGGGGAPRDDRRNNRERGGENRWGGEQPRENRWGGGGAPRDDRRNREGGFRREGAPRDDRWNRGGERGERREGGGRGFTPREGGGGGRGFTPREGGGGRGFTPREGGGGGRGFTPREGGGGGRGFSPRGDRGDRGFGGREGGNRGFGGGQKGRGGNRGGAPRGGGGWR